MEQLSRLKRSLEDACSIVEWNPTASQLQQIAKLLAKSSAIKKVDVASIVASVCPNTKFIAMEGIDNSDLRMLIALAIKVANTKG